MFLVLIANYFPQNNSCFDEYHEFSFEVRVVHPGIDAPRADRTWIYPELSRHGGYFLYDVAAFKICDAPGVFSLYPRHESVQGSDSPRYDIVEFSRD